MIAPSGGGKSTILKEILPTRKDIVYSVSYTTREPRGNERHGVDYFFITEEEFKKKISENRFLEYAEVHGKWYGTSKDFVQDNVDAGNHVIMDIDVQGAEKILKTGFEMVSVFLLPPDPAILEERLINRKTDSDEKIKLRLKNAHLEIAKAGQFQYLVINDDLDTAVRDVKSIIRAEENRMSRYRDYIENYYGGSK